MCDEVAREIIDNISEMALGLDADNMNTEWVDGYQQACRDILLMACRTVNSLTCVLPKETNPL